MKIAEFCAEQFDTITLLHGDCMDYMQQLPNKAFDLAIVDPPYGLPKDAVHGRGKLKGRVLNKNAKEFALWDIKPTIEYFNELFRVSKNQIIWGGNYFALPPTRGIICWDKVQPWKNFSQIEYAWTSFDTPAKLFRFDNRTGGKIHPTQKPVKLYQWLLSTYANPGDKILDTHLGSGSSAIACSNMEFEMTGIEINLNYYESAKERLLIHKRQQKAQYKLF